MDLSLIYKYGSKRQEKNPVSAFLSLRPGNRATRLARADQDGHGRAGKGVRRPCTAMRRISCINLEQLKTIGERMLPIRCAGL